MEKDWISGLLGPWSGDLNLWSVLFRLVLSLVLSAIIGCERSSKRHSAGLRTFILVSLVGTGTMLIDQYLMLFYKSPLPVLSAAGVIGTATLSSNSVLFSSKSQIKGLTTSVGLWCCGVVGIALGALHRKNDCGQHRQRTDHRQKPPIALVQLPGAEQQPKGQKIHAQGGRPLIRFSFRLFRKNAQHQGRCRQNPEHQVYRIARRDQPPFIQPSCIEIPPQAPGKNAQKENHNMKPFFFHGNLLFYSAVTAHTTAARMGWCSR